MPNLIVCARIARFNILMAQHSFKKICASTMLVLICMGSLLPGHTFAADTTNESQKSNPIEPTLNVPIPGVTFTSGDDLIAEEINGARRFAIPYIGEYIGGVVNYAMGIIVLLALLAILFAGVRWVLARGDASAIKEAKGMITGAVAGVCIAFGAYTILYVINPELTEFKSIGLTATKGDPISLALEDSAAVGAQILSGEPAAVPQLANGEYMAGLTVPAASTCPAVITECKNNPTCIAEKQKTRDMAYEAQKKTGYPAGVMLAQLKIEGPTFGKKCKGGFIPAEGNNNAAAAKLACGSQPNCNVGYTWECIAITKLNDKYGLAKPVAAKDFKGGQPINCGSGEKQGKYWRVSGYACFSGAPKEGNVFAPLVDFYQKYGCYKEGRAKYGANPYAFAALLQSCKYATSQTYAAGLISKMKKFCFVGPAVAPLQKPIDQVDDVAEQKTDTSAL